MAWIPPRCVIRGEQLLPGAKNGDFFQVKPKNFRPIALKSRQLLRLSAHRSSSLDLWKVLAMHLSSLKVGTRLGCGFRSGVADHGADGRRRCLAPAGHQRGHALHDHRRTLERLRATMQWREAVMQNWIRTRAMLQNADTRLLQRLEGRGGRHLGTHQRSAEKSGRPAAYRARQSPVCRSGSAPRSLPEGHAPS